MGGEGWWVVVKESGVKVFTKKHTARRDVRKGAAETSKQKYSNTSYP